MEDRLGRLWPLVEACDLGELWALRRRLAARIATLEAALPPQAVAAARAAGQALAPPSPPVPDVGAAELVRAYAAPVRDAGGAAYVAAAYGRARPDGTWEGWLAFAPEGGGPALPTGRETTQPDRAALAYWADGLEPAYLEGALGRAHPEIR